MNRTSGAVLAVLAGVGLLLAVAYTAKPGAPEPRGSMLEAKAPAAAPVAAKASERAPLVTPAQIAEFEQQRKRWMAEARDRRTKAPSVEAGLVSWVYAQNSLSGDERFLGKYVHLSGVVVDVNKTNDGWPAVSLQNHEGVGGVLAVLPMNEEARAAQLVRGMWTTFFCEGKGLIDHRYPWLSCTLQPLPDDVQQEFVEPVRQ